jgi:hypothetical protein
MEKLSLGNEDQRLHEYPPQFSDKFLLEDEERVNGELPKLLRDSNNSLTWNGRAGSFRLIRCRQW